MRIIGKYINRPREPSASGFMIISTVYALILQKAGLDAWITGIALLMLHLLTFDPILNAARTWDMKTMSVLGAVNITPYLVILAYGNRSLIPVLIISMFILGVHFYTVSRKKWNNPLVYITGSAIPVLVSLVIPVASTWYISSKTIVFWILTTIHVVATAAYIESLLPFRKFTPRGGLLLWLPSYAFLAYNPLILIALVEPTIKFVRQSIIESKLTSSPRELKKLGWREFTRFITYTTILLAVLSLT
jgi:hypothetical protein